MAVYKRSGSHKHQKFSRYTGDVGSRRRRRGSFQPWFLIPICALVAFLITLILGSILGSIADIPDLSEPTDSTPQSPARPPAISVRPDEIDAIFVGLEGIYDNTYAEVSKQIPEGTKAISISMFASDGTPLYKSPVAIESSNPCGELTLKNIFRYSNENGIYTSVPFPSEALSMSKGLSASYVAAYEIEMIRELSEAGASEIIIKSDADLSDSEFLDRAVEYLCELQIKVPEINVGFMISAADASNDDTKAAIDTLCDYADFCAVDMTSAKDAEELTSLTDAAIVNILRYKMRVLVRYGSEEEVNAIYSALDTFGIKNRQVIIK